MSGFLHLGTEAEHLGFVLNLQTLPVWLQLLLSVQKIEVGWWRRTVSRDIGNKLTRASIQSHSSFGHEWARQAGWQPIYLVENENVRRASCWFQKTPWKGMRSSGSINDFPFPQFTFTKAYSGGQDHSNACFSSKSGFCFVMVMTSLTWIPVLFSFDPN